eukprot:13055576-Alexandrium_andersonii.AAC.1
MRRPDCVPLQMCAPSPSMCVRKGLHTKSFPDLAAARDSRRDPNENDGEAVTAGGIWALVCVIVARL